MLHIQIVISHENLLRQICCALLHPHGHFTDIVGNPCGLRRFPSVVQRQARGGDDNGGKYSPEQLPVLGHHPHFPAQGYGVDAVQLLPIITDRALIRFFKVRQRPDHRRFTAACAAHDPAQA